MEVQEGSDTYGFTCCGGPQGCKEGGIEAFAVRAGEQSLELAGEELVSTLEKLSVVPPRWTSRGLW